MKIAALLVVGRDLKGQFADGFYEWLLDNFAVFERFCEEAHKLRNAGRKHYSARTIAEFLRHETAVSQRGGDLKLNNNVVPDMARLYLALWNQTAKDFFKLRGR